MLETKLPSSSPLSPPSSSLSSSSSISTHHHHQYHYHHYHQIHHRYHHRHPQFRFTFFNIRNSCVNFIFEFIYVFLTTCFLLFIGFRCNISLTNISIDLLFLALVFLKNFSTFNKQFSKFIMCYKP